MPNPRKNKDTGNGSALPPSPPVLLFPSEAMPPLTPKQQTRALIGLSQAVEHLYRAAFILENDCGFSEWTPLAFTIASPHRLLFLAAGNIKLQAGCLNAAADCFRNIEPTA